MENAAQSEKDNLGYSTENARSAGQAAVMEEATKKKECLFCAINFETNKSLNRLGEFDPTGNDWPLLWVWENPFPQEHQLHHIMILPKRHINNEDWTEITDEEWLQVLDAWKWAQEFYGIPGGGFAGRFGKRSFNEGTVGHLHFQVQIPDLTGNVKITFCKDNSPAEKARRANRATYTKKGLEVIDGFAIRNNRGEFLAEHFHWVKNPFVHVAKSIPHIFNALFEWKIPDLDTITIQPATYTHATEQATPAGSMKTLLWAFLAHEANRNAYEQDTVKGYVFQNAEGLFLSRDFSWEKRGSPENAYVHTEENFRRILAGFRFENPWAIYDAEISANAHSATITGTLLDNRPEKKQPQKKTAKSPTASN